METTPIVKEVTLNAPVARVWRAITDKEEMKKWYFDIAEFKAEPGFEFQFTGGPSLDKQYTHLCTIQEVIPNKKLVHSWKYKGYPGESFVTWELFEEEDNKTSLKLTHSGLETFPADNPDFKKENFIEGWTQIVGTSIKKYVEQE
jgi:uncharacterized protein YndB with AHSA1/START domain